MNEVIVYFNKSNVFKRRLATGDFYFHSVFMAVFIIVLYDRGLGNLYFLQILAASPLLYGFYMHRFYIYQIELENGNLYISWMFWLKSMKTVVPLDKLECYIGSFYKIGNTTLVLQINGRVIKQTITGKWTEQKIKETHLVLSEKLSQSFR